MKIYFLMILVFITQEVLAVSRVGGGKVRSQSSGFEMTLPSDYLRVQPYGLDGVIAKGPQVFTTNRGIVELFIRVGEFAEDFPDAVDMSAADLSLRFAATGWAVHSDQSCVLTFTRSNPNLTSYIVSWGGGKGFVMNGPNFESVNRSMQDMLQTLQLDPGSCAWK